MLLDGKLIATNGKSSYEFTMIDCGNTELWFIDPDLAHKLQSPMYPLPQPRLLTNYEGLLAQSGPVTHFAPLRLELAGGRHSKEIYCLVTKLAPGRPVILGLPWLRRHNPYVDWERSLIRFTSEYC